MRIVDDHGRVQVAARAGNERVPLGEVEQFWRDPRAGIASVNRTGERLDPSGLTLVPPVNPSARITSVGLNYADHVDEGPFTRPDHPTVFG
jgi:2-keto-4-pentenoate hydratase/2-oxohepta-3-ene-1,7-dioic acid hydratase in catechol pathway